MRQKVFTEVRKMTNRQRILLYLSFTLILSSCGRTPLGGLEGEFCAADFDCIEGLVCERSVCLALEEGPDRPGLFFVGIKLMTYTGWGEEQLRELGVFISELSQARFPYFAGHAISATQLNFGMADRSLDPVMLDVENTITSLTLQQSAQGYMTDEDLIILPVVFSNDDVALDIDLPLVNAFLQFDLSIQLGEGTTNGQLLGNLRAVDAENLLITAGSDTFTLFELLRQETLTVDTDFDGVPDAWAVSWTVRAERL